MEPRSYEDLAAAQKRLHEARERLSALLPFIGKAEVAIEYDAEAKKIALADAVKVIRSADAELSQGAAESEARTLASYKDEIRKLYVSYRDAKQVQAEWRLAMADIEIGRTDVSTEKTLAGMQ